MDYDVVVIGAGPGGYVAAIRAAQLGLKTACIEKDKTLGGTCLNVGCIPSKTLLHASELFHAASSSMKTYGVEAESVRLNLKKMMAQKQKVVKMLTTGVAGLFKKNQITSIQGTAVLKGSGKVSVTGEGDAQELTAKHIIVATGSTPAQLPFLKIDEDKVISSTGALSLSSVPQSLLVVGAGIIGLELGSVWSRLGAHVTVVEFLDRVAVTMDGEVSRELKKIFTRQGLKLHVSTKITQAEVGADAVTLKATDENGEELTFEAEKVLVAVGRKPFTDGLGCDAIGLARDELGRIIVDEKFCTNLAGIYAIGDVTPGPMLAHKAEEEGVALAELIAGKSGHVNYGVIPSVLYTQPEAAMVGKTEEELKKDEIGYRVGKFSFRANSRARCVDDLDGFVKILADERSDQILGVHIIGPHAGELIQEAVVAMEYMASAEDLARTVHGHPTFSEAVKEAALAVDGRAIHM